MPAQATRPDPWRTRAPGNDEDSPDISRLLDLGFMNAVPPVASEDTWLVGIDDTDNADSRGTGFHARELVAALEEEGIARAVGVTRHQLLVDDRIPYTSHNSCACIEVLTSDADALAAFCRHHLLARAIDGADVGLCIASRGQAGTVQAFGRRAKTEVLDQQQARDAASAHGIRLEGLTGTRDGIVGALAGVGLFADGNDGRYIWKRRLRDLEDTVVDAATLVAETGIDDVVTESGTSVFATGSSPVTIALGDWPRPVRVGGRSVLIVRPRPAGGASSLIPESVTHECIEKSRIKAFRP